MFCYQNFLSEIKGRKGQNHYEWTGVRSLLIHFTFLMTEVIILVNIGRFVFWSFVHHQVDKSEAESVGNKHIGVEPLPTISPDHAYVTGLLSGEKFCF